MIDSFISINELEGDNAHVQIPNSIFSEIERGIFEYKGKKDVRQVAFAYTYILSVAILYKYCKFVDVDNDTYTQKSDMKKFLGYSKTTKTVDYLIKKGGMLENIGILETSKDIPIYYNSKFRKDDIGDYDFMMMSEVDDDDKELISKIVKNRNYEIQKPIFLFCNDGDLGTLYDYSNTHRVEVRELVEMINKGFDVVDMLIYFYIKSRCKINVTSRRRLSLSIIFSDIGIGNNAFYSRIDKLQKLGIIKVDHKGWSNTGTGESNDYKFIGM